MPFQNMFYAILNVIFPVLKKKIPFLTIFFISARAYSFSNDRFFIIFFSNVPFSGENSNPELGG